MKPFVSIYIGASLDGSLGGFDFDIQTYYEAARGIKTEAVLIGSTTAVDGIEKYMDEIPPEEKSDMQKSTDKKRMPLWVMVDSKGKLKDKLHVYRRFEFCKDVIVFITEDTPKDYIEYLRERDYDYINTGSGKVNLRLALETLNSKYNVNFVKSDSGIDLNRALIADKLADELCIFLHPVITNGSDKLQLNNLTEDKLHLKLAENRTVQEKYLFIRYNIVK